MEERRGQLVERLRQAEQARDLLRELERLLKEDGPELGRTLERLDALAQPLPEADRIRWFIESAVGSARSSDRSAKAGSDVSRSRSAVEGELSTLRGTIDRGVT